MYWDFAPNGNYKVLFYKENYYGLNYNETSVFFPICEHCPTQLHGVWATAENLQWDKDGWYIVHLQENKITEVAYLENG